MFGVNRTILIGYVGRTPTTICSRKQVHICSFPIDTKSAAAAGKSEETIWHKIIAYGELALECQKKVLPQGSVVKRTRNHA